jgi:hypothetical protein
MGAAFSPNQAKVLLQRNALNTAKKVESGKPLTPKELAMLEQIAEGGDGATAKTFADNQVELATILGVNRKTIQRWLKHEDSPETRADGRYEVSAWREFKQQHGKGGDDFDDDIDVARAKAEQIILQNERLKFRIKQDRGEVLPKTLAKEVFGKLLVSAKSRTYASIVRMVTLARLAPNTALAAEEVKKEVDSIWQSLTDSQWLK